MLLLQIAIIVITTSLPHNCAERFLFLFLFPRSLSKFSHSPSHPWCCAHHLRLALPEVLLPVAAEDVGHALLLVRQLDDGVRVKEGVLERVRQHAPHGGLAAAHHADQVDAAPLEVLPDLGRDLRQRGADRIQVLLVRGRRRQAATHGRGHTAMRMWPMW